MRKVKEEILIDGKLVATNDKFIAVDGHEFSGADACARYERKLDVKAELMKIKSVNLNGKTWYMIANHDDLDVLIEHIKTVDFANTHVSVDLFDQRQFIGEWVSFEAIEVDDDVVSFDITLSSLSASLRSAKLAYEVLLATVKLTTDGEQ